MSKPEIHPQGVVAPGARLAAGVKVGPFASIGEGVELGEGCQVHAHAVVQGPSTFGCGNVFHPFCVIGGDPQDYTFGGERTELRVGEENVFREYVTVSRGTKKGGGVTRIGDKNFFLAYTHIGHDCQIGNSILFVNAATLAGHVTIEDFATIGALSPVHQFCRVGTLAIMQGGSAISKDLPPFSVAMRVNEMCGLNSVGLRRAGSTAGQRLELKRLYHLLFRSGKNLREALDEAKKIFSSDLAKVLLDFLSVAKRGVCADVGHAPLESEEE